MQTVSIIGLIILFIGIVGAVAYSITRWMIYSDRKNRALELWSKGIRGSEKHAMEFLSDNLSPAASRYIALLLQDRKSFTCNTPYFSDVKQSITVLTLAVDHKRVHFWIGCKSPILNTWSDKNNNPVAQISVQEGCIKLFILDVTPNQDVKLMYDENIPHEIKGIDLEMCFKYIIGRMDENTIESPVYQQLKSILKAHPEEAVKFLSDPVIKEYAAEILDGGQK